MILSRTMQDKQGYLMNSKQEYLPSQEITFLNKLKEKKIPWGANEQKIKKLKSELEKVKNNYNKEAEKRKLSLIQSQTQINDL